MQHNLPSFPQFLTLPPFHFTLILFHLLLMSWKHFFPLLTSLSFFQSSPLSAAVTLLSSSSLHFYFTPSLFCPHGCFPSSPLTFCPTFHISQSSCFYRLFFLPSIILRLVLSQYFYPGITAASKGKIAADVHKKWMQLLLFAAKVQPEASPRHPLQTNCPLQLPDRWVAFWSGHVSRTWRTPSVISQYDGGI